MRKKKMFFVISSFLYGVKKLVTIVRRISDMIYDTDSILQHEAIGKVCFVPRTQRFRVGF